MRRVMRVNVVAAERESWMSCKENPGVGRSSCDTPGRSHLRQRWIHSETRFVAVSMVWEGDRKEWTHRCSSSIDLGRRRRRKDAVPGGALRRELMRRTRTAFIVRDLA